MVKTKTKLVKTTRFQEFLKTSIFGLSLLLLLSFLLFPKSSLAFFFLDDTVTEFSQGTYGGTQWDSGNSWLEWIGNEDAKELPNDSGSGGWFDMTNNKLLFHLNESVLNGAPGGTDFEDKSVNSNHGSELGGIEYNVKKHLNKGIGLENSGDYISVPNNSTIDFDTNENFSVMLWVRPDFVQYSTMYTSNELLTKWSGGAPYPYAIRYTNQNHATPGKVSAHRYDLTNAPSTGYSAVSINDGAFHHVAFVKDGSVLKLYIDGNLSSSGTDTTTGTTKNSSIMTIGRRGNGEAQFGGDFDEVAIFSGALSNTDIRIIYDTQRGNYFTSRIVNAGSSTTWNDIRWNPERPTHKELPNSAGTESGYDTGNIDMTGNVLLTHMNEASWNGTANEVVDSSGTGNDGTAYNSATTISSGKLGRGGDFRASTSARVVIPDDATLDISGDLTLSAWVYPTAYADFDIIINKGHTSDVNPWTLYGLRFSNENDGLEGVLFVISVGLDDKVCHAPNSVPLNKWTHITGTYNGTYQKVYINGIEACSMLQSGSINTNNQEIYIGKYKWNSYNHFTGYMDEVGVWNRAMDSNEALSMYLRGATRLKYQVRSCNDASCSGESFMGPDGTESTYYSELSNTTLGLPILSLTNVPDNQYFQYQAFFETDNASYSPELNNFGANEEEEEDEPTIPEFEFITMLIAIVLGLGGFYLVYGWYTERKSPNQV